MGERAGGRRSRLSSILNRSSIGNSSDDRRRTSCRKHDGGSFSNRPCSGVSTSTGRCIVRGSSGSQFSRRSIRIAFCSSATSIPGGRNSVTYRSGRGGTIANTFRRRHTVPDSFSGRCAVANEFVERHSSCILLTWCSSSGRWWGSSGYWCTTPRSRWHSTCWRSSRWRSPRY